MSLQTTSKSPQAIIISLLLLFFLRGPGLLVYAHSEPPNASIESRNKLLTRDDSTSAPPSPPWIDDTLIAQPPRCMYITSGNCPSADPLFGNTTTCSMKRCQTWSSSGQCLLYQTFLDRSCLCRNYGLGACENECQGVVNRIYL